MCNIVRPSDLFKLANNSKCIRAKVGAVGKDSKGNIFVGWNHMEDGSECEHSPELSKQEVKHAEIDVIDQSDDLVSLSVTHSPCLNCAKRIVTEGIPYVEYVEEYRLVDGVNYLLAHGVKVVKLDSIDIPTDKPIIDRGI